MEVLFYVKNLNCGMRKNHKRCTWCEGSSLYEEYHDQEWGVRIIDDLKLFEFLTLETFQAGLSWITVLRKREHFRLAFDQFDYEKLHKVTKVVTNNLNRVIDINFYPTPKTKVSNIRGLFITAIIFYL